MSNKKIFLILLNNNRKTYNYYCNIIEINRLRLDLFFHFYLQIVLNFELLYLFYVEGRYVLKRYAVERRRVQETV